MKKLFTYAKIFLMCLFIKPRFGIVDLFRAVNTFFLRLKFANACLPAFFLLITPLLAEESVGKWINPVTDICWSCMFPIHVAGSNITPNHKDGSSYKSTLCFCTGHPPKAGVPLAFWEPTYLIDVTRTPYKFPGLGGISIAKAGVRNRGTISNVGQSGRTSFYNIHFYTYPVMKWLGAFDEFSCIETGELAVAYMSEFDPAWNDNEWASVLTPEASLFSNPLAQAACIADCGATSLGKTVDSLFWCAGCHGSLYPFVGHVAHHIGGIQASHLLVQRLIAKLHSVNMLRTFKKENFCQKTLTPRIKKSAYKTQLLYPVANSKGPCVPLGKSDVFWGAGKAFPYKGEDFVYLIWTKKQCCLDAIKPVIKAVSGGVG